MTFYWTTWVSLLLGLWLIAAPFVLGYAATTTALYNDIILGVAVLVFTYLGALQRQRQAT